VVHWKAFKHGDKEYDLCHLHPKTVSYMQPAKGINPPRYYKVDVIFSLHCFTRGMEGETPDPELLYSATVKPEYSTSSAMDSRTTCPAS
jgi:hypothetical protein